MPLLIGLVIGAAAAIGAKAAAALKELRRR